MKQEYREEYSEPRYVISIAARMLGIQTHTLRYYEKIGIVEPSRSPGKIRLYSQQDMDQLRRVKTIMNDLGVNLAAAEVIMRMAKRIAELQEKLEQLERELEEFHRRNK